MSVKRYEVNGTSSVFEDANGSLVDYEDYAALEAKCAALAAENAGLKSAIDSTIGWQQSTDPENVESVRMLVDINTPATDAFLAEVRASGVEMFADDLLCPDLDSTIREFAAQLRKGVQS
ncbi:hypothetical protein [Enterobacter sp. V87_3]|uniref:hypothetical protein n=1 Tax=Enterobacter sp. V87_3 TaxID=3044236 RepID=UPI00249E05F5|nr:hypothetical protein [Enterobacter sp. V87_3]MDI3424635.1 hypothetical protein [Enterobacter sp. V87_3]